MTPEAVDLNALLIVEREWFSQALPVDRTDVDPGDMQGFDVIADETIIELCGAPVGAGVMLRFDGQALFFDVVGSNYLRGMNTVSLHVDHVGEPYLYVDFIDFVETAPAGLGAAMLWRVVRACAALQIPRILLSAVGGRGYGPLPDGTRVMGYYAWPRYGFDGEVQSAEDARFFQQFPHFPEGLADGTARSLLDLFASPGGREFWLVGGRTRDLTFEVASTSRSVITLHRYLTNKGFFHEPDYSAHDANRGRRGTGSRVEQESAFARSRCIWFWLRCYSPRCKERNSGPSPGTGSRSRAQDIQGGGHQGGDAQTLHRQEDHPHHQETDCRDNRASAAANR